jgi:hypothetical protein
VLVGPANDIEPPPEPEDEPTPASSQRASAVGVSEADLRLAAELAESFMRRLSSHDFED